MTEWLGVGNHHSEDYYIAS